MVPLPIWCLHFLFFHYRNGDVLLMQVSCFRYPNVYLFFYLLIYFITRQLHFPLTWTQLFYLFTRQSFSILLKWGPFLILDSGLINDTVNGTTENIQIEVVDLWQPRMREVSISNNFCMTLVLTCWPYWLTHTHTHNIHTYTSLQWLDGKSP